MLEQGNEVTFNFSNKKGNLQCYILNYNLASYLNKKHLQECLKTPKKAIIDMEEINYIYAFFINILCDIHENFKPHNKIILTHD